jgi:hypothetical protein
MLAKKEQKPNKKKKKNAASLFLPLSRPNRRNGKQNGNK